MNKLGLSGWLGLLALAGGCSRGDLGQTTLASTVAESSDAGAAGVAAVGDHVKVKVSVTPAGPVAASLHVDRAPKNAGRAELEGPVGAVDPAAGTLSVVGVSLTVGPATGFKNVPGGALAGLKVGDWVEVAVAVGATGALEATKIESILSEVEGTVEAVTEMNLQVLGLSIAVNPETVVNIHRHEHEGHKKGGGHHGDDDDHDEKDKP